MRPHAPSHFEAVNSISMSGMLTSSHLLGQKVKPRWPPMEGNFVCQFASVSVPYTALLFTFCLVRLRNYSQPWKKYSDKILLDQFYINEHLKVLIIALWPKKCAKLSKGRKLTVKSGCAFSSFLK